MGAIVECTSDEKGLVWPEEVAPFQIHLIALSPDVQEMEQCELLYDQLKTVGLEVLYDDRQNIRAGEKFADADIIGIPHRLVGIRPANYIAVVAIDQAEACRSQLSPGQVV
jgi:prolyl-tRNA synthetase